MAEGVDEASRSDASDSDSGAESGPAEGPWGKHSEWVYLMMSDPDAYDDIVEDKDIEEVKTGRALRMARAQLGWPVTPSPSSSRAPSPEVQVELTGGNDMGRLASVPAELLEHIFVQCEPRDLAALSQTCKGLYRFLREAPHVWEHIFARLWDTPERKYDRTVRHDAVLALAAPFYRRASSRKGKERQQDDEKVPDNMIMGLAWHEHKDKRLAHQYERWRKMQASSRWDPTFLYGSTILDSSDQLAKLYIDEHVYPGSREFDLREQCQRRIWAEGKVKQSKTRHFEVLSDYNAVIQTLLSIARSRTQRSEQQDDITEDSSSARYLEALFSGADGVEAFRRLVYPRTDLHRLREWQLERAQKDFEAGAKAGAHKADGRKRTQSSASGTEKKRQKSSKASGSRGARRRSRRLMMSAYPTDLQHILSDNEGNARFDANGEPLRLEDIGAIDEQLAAELHVLHGVLPAHNRIATRPASSLHVLGATADETGEEDGTVVDGDEDDEGDVAGLLHGGIRFYRRIAFNLNLGGGTCGEKSTALRARAREIVYDTARYGPENSYGPLKPWRTRINDHDGPRETREDEDDDGDGIDEDDHLSDDESHMSLHDEDDVQVLETNSDGAQSPNVPAHDDPDVIDLTDLPEANSDDEFEEDDDEFDPDDLSMGDFGMLEHLYNGSRDLHLRMTRGMLPWLESQRLANITKKYLDVPLPVKTSYPMFPGAMMEPCWSTEMRVDWIAVEAIMIVMSCNLRSAILREGWGQAYRLPAHERSLTGRDTFAQRTLEELTSPTWKDVLGLPCGWDHTRASALKPNPLRKSWDWANVESTWIGTYAFLDWNIWSLHNSRDPHHRGYPATNEDESRAFDACRPMQRGTTHDATSLQYEAEAVGDCLQLRMELLPLEKPEDRSEEEKVLEGLLPNDEGRYFKFEKTPPYEYPPLKFRGQTMNVLDDGQITPRGAIHGSVRPIYAPRSSGYNSRKDGPRAVAALHWEITHRYDGEDRWTLSGIQPGPPGTRAPIYGIWGASDRWDNTSPCGPFVYYMVDDRPWKQVADLLAQEDAAAQRSARP